MERIKCNCSRYKKKIIRQKVKGRKSYWTNVQNKQLLKKIVSCNVM